MNCPGIVSLIDRRLWHPLTWNYVPADPGVWLFALGDAEKIKQVYLPGKEYTLERLERYAEGNIVSTLKTYAIAHDGDLTKLVKAVEGCRLNNKQRMLLAQLESAKIQPKETEY